MSIHCFAKIKSLSFRIQFHSEIPRFDRTSSDWLLDLVRKSSAGSPSSVVAALPAMESAPAHHCIVYRENAEELLSESTGLPSEVKRSGVRGRRI